MGLTPWRRPIGLKAVSQGIMLLSIPMECSVKCKQTEEVCPYYVQVKRYVHKRMFLFMYKEKFMYIKRIGTYTVRETYWLKEISQGILSLEPMDSVHRQTNEKQTKEICLRLNINNDNLSMYK